MDVLVIVGEQAPPERLRARAAHLLRVGTDGLRPDQVGQLRGRIPRQVGVFGTGAAAVAVATSLHRAGLPVTLYTDPASGPASGPGSGTGSGTGRRAAPALLDGTPTAPAGVRVLPASDTGPPMEVAGSLLDLVGHTPMVRLDRVGRDLACHLVAKLEYLNPGGSVKDRPALAMVEAAEREGRLGPGGTIVEPTSGNTGVGLAIVAARRRYRCIFTMPDKIAAEKIQLLRAYGAEVVVCPTAVAPEHPDSYYSVANRLEAEMSGAFQPNQYRNPNNPASHQATTGPEVWRQTAGRVTHFVAGIGTGGTISGVGRHLKERNPEVQVVGADPEGSVYSGGSGRPYLVEGIGEDFWPTTYDPSVVDRVVMVTDRDSFLTARRVTREEGLLLGGSGGTAVWAALEVGRHLGPESVVVVLLPDSGRGYLSKLYDEHWMADYGFLRSGGQAAADVLQRKAGAIPPLVHVHPDETVRSAIAVLKEFGVSQLPVVKDLPASPDGGRQPVLAMAEVVGTVAELSLLEHAFADPSVLDRPVSTVMGPRLPTIGGGESVELTVQRLEQAPAVLVLDNGHPVGILTRSDLLEFLSRPPA